MDNETITQFQNRILEWYEGSARTLPWRNNPSPYRVWISEIMLQQTRVDTVRPYFEKFIDALPTIEALAHTSDDKLLKLWEGLGYYSRARNLKRAANIILQKFSGQIPSDIKALESLPGIGPYSSGAIASIAFGARVPAIDGNVLRVMARVSANKGDITNRLVNKEIKELVNTLLPKERIGDFNQALMELGASICLPNGLPKCLQCPINFTCEGYHRDMVAMIPMKLKKKPRKIERKTVFVMKSEGRVALRQRPSEGLLSNLWELPHVEGHLSYEDCQSTLIEWSASVFKIIKLDKAKHIFTHMEWHMIGYLVLIETQIEDSSLVWATPKEIETVYSIPTAFKAYLEYFIFKDK